MKDIFMHTSIRLMRVSGDNKTDASSQQVWWNLMLPASKTGSTAAAAQTDEKCRVGHGRAPLTFCNLSLCLHCRNKRGRPHEPRHKWFMAPCQARSWNNWHPALSVRRSRSRLVHESQTQKKKTSAFRFSPLRPQICCFFWDYTLCLGDSVKDSWV